MEGTTFVTTEALRNTATEFSNTMTQIQNMTSNMTDDVNGLAATYQGEAADTFFNRFKMLQDDITKLASRVNEHVKDLNESADNFERGVDIIVEKASSLPGNVMS